jgi:hypothetical protein
MNHTILNHDSFDYSKSAVIPPPELKTENKRVFRMVIDSRDRNKELFPEPSKYDILFDEEIEDVNAVELLSADVPFSAHLVNRNNRRFRLIVPSESFDQVIQVETGDYTTATLATAVRDAIQAALTAASIVATTLKVEYDPVKDGFVFRSTAPFSLNFLPAACTIPGASDCKSTLSTVLGFDRKIYASTDATATGLYGDGHVHRILGPYRKNFDEIKYLILDIAGLSVNKSKNNLVNKSFAIIDKSDYLNTHLMNHFRKTLNPPMPKFDRIKVAFYDYDGNLYDFQNQDHRFELLFESYKMTRRYLMS